MPQFPDAANQGRVRIALRRQRSESGEKFVGAMGSDSPACDQFPQCAHHFDIDQMRNDERLIASEQLAPDGVGEGAVCEEFDDHGGVQDDHRESRNSRITCAGLLPGLARSRREAHGHNPLSISTCAQEKVMPFNCGNPL